MQAIPIKNLGDSLYYGEYTSHSQENENIVLTGGIALSTGDNYQCSKAISNYVAKGDFYTVGGTANAITLTVVSPFQAPTAYFNGLRARFIASANNTTAATVNVAGIGVKNIKKSGYSADLSSGDIKTGYHYDLVYNLSTDNFELLEANFLQLSNIPNTLVCLNYGALDASGNPSLITKNSNTVVNVLATTTPYTITYADRSSETISADTTITSGINEGLNGFIKTKGNAPVSVNLPQFGKDLFVDFSRADATDNYRLHSVTVIGSPTFSGGKFVGVGSGTGVKYPDFTTIGTSNWSISAKFKFNNTNATNYLFRSNAVSGITLYRSSGNQLSLSLSSNGSTYDIASGVLGAKSDFSTSIEYTLRLRFTGTAYEVGWSTDGGTTYTTDITVTNSNVIYSALGYLKFGIHQDEASSALNGTMDDIRITIGSSTIIPKYLITQSNAYPTTANYFDGCYVMHTGVEPIQTYLMTSGSPVATQYAQFPMTAPVAAGVMATPIAVRAYNQNGYNVNTNTLKRYVIKTYLSGTSWYTKYSDGWIEQGGIINLASAVTGTITFIAPFIATPLWYMANPATNDTNPPGSRQLGYGATNLQFNIIGQTYTANYYWYAFGY